MDRKKNRKVPILTLLLGIGLLIAITWSTSKMLYLKFYGKKAGGIVQSVYRVGSKGKMICKYTFYISGRKYRGNVMFNLLSKGDSIIVLYAPNNPKINVPEKFIEAYY